VSLTGCRDARSHYHQHHHPQARVARHGNTPCFTLRESEAPGTLRRTVRHHTNTEAESPTRRGRGTAAGLIASVAPTPVRGRFSAERHGIAPSQPDRFAIGPTHSLACAAGLDGAAHSRAG
jgi:hypothetical protein